LGWWLALVFGSLFGFWIGFMLFAKYALAPEEQLEFEHGIAAGVGVALALATAWLFIAARRRSLIRTETILVGLVGWIALGALAAPHWALHMEESLTGYVFMVGLLALVVAPLAAAPLALAWNRTR
jgi:hypothetical protein